MGSYRKLPAPENTAYVYVVTRRDLPPSHLTVQVAHAVLAATTTYNSYDRPHPHMVVCAVNNEAELDEFFNHLKEQGVPCCAYYEPDFGNAMTGIATAPIVGAHRRAFRKLKLL